MLYFILGILFISIGIPIIENIESILSAFTQYIVYILAVKVYLLKNKIPSEEKEQEESQDFKIGFHSTEAIGYEITAPEDQKEE